MAPLPKFDLSVDELRVSLSYAVANIALSLRSARAAAAPAARKASAAIKAPSPPPNKAVKNKNDDDDDDDDDFDVFGDNDDDDDDNAADDVDEAPKESRAEMLARLKREAEERTAMKEAKQRTLVAMEIKPWDVEQDLLALWKKITTTVVQDGLKWGEQCTLADVAYGIKKIQCTFVMGVNNSSDDVVDAILEMENEVQSCEITSMNVL